MKEKLNVFRVSHISMFYIFNKSFRKLFFNCPYPFADVLHKMYALVPCHKQIVSIFQVILQEKYRLLNTFSAKLDPIYFSLLFVQLTEDLCPNSTSLTHFLQRYCSVLLCIYTRLAANRFLVDRVLSEQARYMN